MCQWMASVSFRTEGHGVIEVDYAIDKLGELDHVLENMYGPGAIEEIRAIPAPIHDPNATIESLMQKLAEKIDSVEPIEPEETDPSGS